MVEWKDVALVLLGIISTGLTAFVRWLNSRLSKLEDSQARDHDKTIRLETLLETIYREEYGGGE